MTSTQKDVPSVSTAPHHRTRHQTEVIKHYEENRDAEFADLQNLMVTIKGTTDQDQLKTYKASYIEKYRKFQTKHNQICEILTDEELQLYLKNWYSSREETITNFQHYLDTCTSRPTSSNIEITPHDSISQTKTNTSRSRSSSNSSSLSTLRLKQRQENAVIELKRKKLIEKQKISKEQLELQLREEQLQLETEEEIAQAKTRIIEESIQHRESEFRSKLNPDADAFVLKRNPVNSPQIKESPSLEISSTDQNIDQTTTIIQNMKKPPVKLKSFSGDPIDYRRFVRAFETKILPFTINDDERMNYLEQYTEGQANRVVRGLSNLDAKEGYPAAIEQLKKRYGNNEVIASSFCKRALEHKPVSKPNDIDEYGILLTECYYAIKSIEGMKILEYPENIKRLIQKLPFYLHDRWRSIVEQKREKDEPINFSLLVEFVTREGRKLADPTYGKEALSQPSTNTNTNLNVKYKPKPTLTTQLKKNDDTSTSAEGRGCFHCKQNHKIDSCPDFKNKLHYEKIEILKKNGYCFGCLKKGHMKSECPSKEHCTKCKFNHPTILHIEPHEYKYLFKPQEALPVKAHALTRAGDCMKYTSTMTIVPVKVRRRNGLKATATYAFLDNGSSVTFCTERLMNKLGIQGRRTIITLETMTNNETISSYQVDDLEVFSYDFKNSINIPRCYSKDKLPVDIEHIPTKKDIEKWPHLNNLDIPEIDFDCGIDLMIGNNIPDAYTPYETVTGPRGSPHATKTALGWLLWNILRETKNESHNIINRIEIQRIIEYERLNEMDKLLHQQILNDFPERTVDDRLEPSYQDKAFYEKVENSLKYINGRYQISLPFKDNDVKLPDNREMVLRRLYSLERKLKGNNQFKSDYTEFMNSMVTNGYAEEVPINEIERRYDKTWFVPHHGVYHKQKRKIRAVFDCSAKCKGVSLNDVLLPGPDLANNLLGVLMRFRIHRYALMSDIQSMFHMVKLPTEDRDSLRFLWWPNGNLDAEVKEYRMTCFLFGAICSPSIANYALQRTASDFSNKFESDVTNTILDNFYVDDCLRSVSEVDEGINLVEKLTELCRLGGFRLHKWITNSEEILLSIPESERATTKVTSLGQDESIIERALGVNWDVSSDTLTFKINVKEQPYTRRGLLSIISSIFDPLGLVAPVMLYPKTLLQELCQKGISWDQEIDESHKRKWYQWLQELPNIANLQLPRCIKPQKFNEISSIQIHTFSDASLTGYGVCSYIRLIDINGMVTCRLLLGKSRVTPIKRITVPRLELTAATVAVKLTKKIITELKINIENIYYWTDSTTVLGYIANETTRFQTFVANRVSVIREATTLNQWRKVNTEDNPADDASRGLLIDALISNERWFYGPKFLHEERITFPDNYIAERIPETDPEVKKVHATTVIESPDVVDQLLSYHSDWNKLRKSTAWILRIKDQLKLKKDDRKQISHLNTEDFERAENCIIQHEQQKYLKNSIEVCLKGDNHQRTKLENGVSKLDPFVDTNGILRVGGRLKKSNMDLDSKHQIILPKDSRLSEIIIRNTHSQIGHLGKNAIMSEVRRKYWIVGASKIIKSIIAKCVICRRNLAKTNQQKMADLPLNRITPSELPFAYTGMDFFGPYEIRFKRSTLKRYGAIFTCFNSRAVHLEIVSTMDTDSCINCIRRFIARRGVPKVIRSDNGSNIVGAVNELKQCLTKLNQKKINDQLLQSGIKWEFNPPAASNFGGVWERIIRMVRKILNSLLREQMNRLDDESLSTLFCEVEAILNNRPLTKISETPNDLDALTPNHLLQAGSRLNLAPVLTQKTDLYVKRRWRQVQYLTDVFWRRWSTEYLPCLQERQKWLYPSRCVAIDDIVLVLDNSVRNSWTLARVLDVYPDSKGVIRVAKVKTQISTFDRPVNKLCVLLEAEE